MSLRYIILLFFVSHVILANAQLAIGISTSYSRAFEELIPESKKNNWGLGIVLETFTDSKFYPILEISYSTQAFNKIYAIPSPNDGVFFIRDHLINAGLSSNVLIHKSEIWKTGLNIGIGLSYFFDSYVGYSGHYLSGRLNDNKLKSDKNLLPSIHSAYFLSNEIFEKYIIQVTIGVDYYPIKRNIGGYFEFENELGFNKRYDVDANAISVRPFIKLTGMRKYNKSY